MDTATILTIFGAIGGAETIKWVVNYFATRKQNGRLRDAEVSKAELNLYKERVDWLEARLAQRDTKIDALYAELRGEQASKLQLLYEKHEVELKLKEAEVRRCNVRGCERREPPSDY